MDADEKGAPWRFLGEASGLGCAVVVGLVELLAGYLEVVWNLGPSVILPLLALVLVPLATVAWLRRLVVRHGADPQGVTVFVGQARLVYSLSVPLLLVGYFLGVGCGMPWRFGYC
jgi:hypothetical protein